MDSFDGLYFTSSTIREQQFFHGAIFSVFPFRCWGIRTLMGCNHAFQERSNLLEKNSRRFFKTKLWETRIGRVLIAGSSPMPPSDCCEKKYLPWSFDLDNSQGRFCVMKHVKRNNVLDIIPMSVSNHNKIVSTHSKFSFRKQWLSSSQTVVVIGRTLLSSDLVWWTIMIQSPATAGKFYPNCPGRNFGWNFSTITADRQ